MKICITARDRTLNSSFEPHFARAPFFIIHDTENGRSEAIRNGFVISNTRIGQNAVRLLENNGVEVVITGEVGENARALLNGSGIALRQLTVTGTARQALAEFLSYEMEQQKRPA